VASSTDTPRRASAQEQIVELAKRLRTDPEFLSQVEGVISHAEKTHKVRIAAFNAVFTRKDVREALYDIQHAARKEQLDGKDIAAIMAHHEAAADNAVAAAIVAAAASTAAAAFV
jgi:hypothetical protein